jgi:uncharacterized RDD family membrane protein YckC
MSVLGLNLAGAQPAVVGAGFWIRALARFLDTLYGLILGFVVGVFGGVLLLILQGASFVEPGWQQRLAGSRISGFVVGLFAFTFYHTLSEGISGISFGKLACGLRVVNEDLTPCSLKPALIRSLAYFVDALVFGLVAYLSMGKSPTEQRHGDHWAHTMVVKSSEVPETSRRGGARMIAGLAAGTAVWAGLIFTHLMLSAL